MNHKLTATFAALLLGCCTGAVLGGCGSSETKTVTVASSPAETPSTQAQASTATTPPTTTATTTTATTNTAGGTPAPTNTRTQTAPAFTHEETKSEGLSQAESVLQAKGYSASEASQYHPNQALRVLIGTKSGSSDGYGQQAFFFVNGRYIGTDTKEPSATVKVLSQNDTEVTLAYPLYHPGDPLANPSGGQATVHFQLNDGKLTPLGAIPPANSSTGLSRN
ncbi:MAG TPA: LppP/LprE family lipoprotein [Solirubrobacteraceae bacterium]